MKSFQNLLLKEFIQKSDDLDAVRQDRINRTKEFILWAEVKIEELHHWLKTYDFENQNHEICFFKEIKPCMIAKLIVQKEVLHLETNAPMGKANKRNYFTEELHKIAINTQKDSRFYQYFRSNSVELDAIYFTRASKKNYLETDCFQIISDDRITTCYDFKVAKIQANDELITYLENRIERLERKKKHQELQLDSNLVWTDSKINLVEFVYGLYFSKSINNGDCEVLAIAKQVGKAFNVEVDKNCYRIFNDIKTRNAPQARFLNTMAQNIHDRILEEEFS